MLQQQPTIGDTGTRYAIVIDLACPYCNQFLSGDAFAKIHEKAREGQAQLDVTAAFLHGKNVINESPRLFQMLVCLSQAAA